MRLSEFITIYLAAAAPFGVAHFQRRPSDESRARRLTRALMPALVWPLVVLWNWRGERLKKARPASTRMAEETGTGSRTLIVERAEQALISSLRRAEKLLAEAASTDEGTALSRRFVERSDAVLDASMQTRASVERYAGLALAVADAERDAAPAPPEIELYRLDGRTGDELELAARCVHRRHTARLREHHARSRYALLHALADLRERNERLPLASAEEAALARRLAEALVPVFARAVELFSLLEEPAAALAGARLLDAECARLRQMENFAADARQLRRLELEGEKPCPTASLLTANDSPSGRRPLPQTTLTRG